MNGHDKFMDLDLELHESTLTVNKFLYLSVVGVDYIHGELKEALQGAFLKGSKKGNHRVVAW